ncbi:MAG: hypothetical protein ACHQ53_07890 [Polyangiales bacterium]
MSDQEDDADKLQQRLEREHRQRNTLGKALAEGARHAARGVAAAVGTAITGSPAGGLALGTFATMGLEGLRQHTGAEVQSRSDAFLQHLDRVIPAYQVPPESDPRRKDLNKTLFQAYRHLMAAMDEAVIPALARLVADYNGKKPDSFFRAGGNVFEVVSAEELAAWIHLFGRIDFIIGCNPHLQKSDRITFRFGLDNHREQVLTVARASEDTIRIPNADLPELRRLYEVLITQGLIQREGQPQECSIDRLIFERLMRIIETE